MYIKQRRNELIPFFSLAVRLVTDTDIRIARLKEREKRKFGSRIEKGGDMYQNHWNVNKLF